MFSYLLGNIKTCNLRSAEDLPAATKKSTQSQGGSQFGPSLMDLLIPMVHCTKAKMAAAWLPGLSLIFITSHLFFPHFMLVA